MCYTVDKSLNVKTFTGYKIVTKDAHGHLYSAFTGVRYEAGKTMKHPKHQGKYASWTDTNQLDKNNVIYNEKIIGRTAVFVNRETAIAYPTNNMFFGKPTYIAEMTLSGDLRYGDFYYDSVVSGTKIESIKLLK